MCFTIDIDDIHPKSLTTIKLMIEVDLHASNFEEFSCSTPDLVNEMFTFGQEDVLNSILVRNCDKSDLLFRITKIVSFAQDPSNIVNVYIEKDNPLMILSTSELGIVKTYFL
ncbi:hypothetical protein DPMN_011386 [Dreissena polymorpha]|uniref:Uncharacterized protein n=1 Tax=Dreissena polymorpha TaxID=45954 RepID=A0A9D4S1T3_DREPO|nr:hypothetical protein DPMN_011386 [Dreissena polymorpha]